MPIQVWSAKLLIFGRVSKKYLQTLDGEAANISDFADFAGSEQIDVAPTAVVVVTEGDAVMKLQDWTVAFPNWKIDGVAGVKDMSGGGDVDWLCHPEYKRSLIFALILEQQKLLIFLWSLIFQYFSLILRI